MRYPIIKTIFMKECREMLRDRRSLAIMFGIPLLLYPLLTVLIASIGLAKSKQLAENPATIAVINASEAPHLLEMMNRKTSGVKLEAPKDPTTDLTEGKLDVIVVVPPQAERDALVGKENPITMRLDRSRTTSL